MKEIPGPEKISGRIIDGLGRPIEGVKIELTVLKKEGSEIKKEVLYTFLSDKEGRYQGIIDRSTQELWFECSKEEYGNLSTSPGWEADMGDRVMHKKIGDIKKFIKSLRTKKGADLKENLLELFGSSTMMFGGPMVKWELFQIDRKVTAPLREFLSSDQGYYSAIEILCCFSNPQDLQEILKRAKERDELYGSLAGALISPTTEDEWEYLKKCIQYANDTRRWRFAEQAALALGVSGGEKSLRILKSISVKPGRIAGRQIQNSIRWIQTHSENLKKQSSLKKCVEEAAGVFLEEGERDKFSIQKIIYNSNKKKALVTCLIHHDPTNARGYDMVFHKEKGDWVLKGIWFTFIS